MKDLIDHLIHWFYRFSLRRDLQNRMHREDIYMLKKYGGTGPLLALTLAAELELVPRARNHLENSLYAE